MKERDQRQPGIKSKFEASERDNERERMNEEEQGLDDERSLDVQ
jgi:hypothetical protein